MQITDGTACTSLSGEVYFFNFAIGIKNSKMFLMQKGQFHKNRGFGRIFCRFAEIEIMAVGITQRLICSYLVSDKGAGKFIPVKLFAFYQFSEA